MDQTKSSIYRDVRVDGIQGGYVDPDNYDKSFNDVNSSYWAHDVIMKMAAKQIVLGVSDTAFAPKQNVTRADQ